MAANKIALWPLRAAWGTQWRWLVVNRWPRFRSGDAYITAAQRYLREPKGRLSAGERSAIAEACALECDRRRAGRLQIQIAGEVEVLDHSGTSADALRFWRALFFDAPKPHEHLDFWIARVVRVAERESDFELAARLRLALAMGPKIAGLILRSDSGQLCADDDLPLVRLIKLAIALELVGRQPEIVAGRVLRLVLALLNRGRIPTTSQLLACRAGRQRQSKHRIACQFVAAIAAITPRPSSTSEPI